MNFTKTIKLFTSLLTLLLWGSLLIIVMSCKEKEKPYKNQAFISSKPSPKIIRNFKAIGMHPDFDTTLVSQYIRSIFQDSKGNLWFGTLQGLVRYDEKTLTYFSTPDGFISESVFAINEDKHGNLWIGTDKGLYKYDGKSFRNYNQKDGLNHVEISRKSILVDQAGTIWVGTHGGIYLYNPTADMKGSKSFSLFKKLPPINVADIIEDKKGNIWIATFNKGVFIYNGKTIINLNGKEDLGINYAGGIAQDSAGNIWLTFKNGIVKYDGNKLTEYTAKDGLGGTEIWGLIIEQSGIIWITARGSTTRFNPSIPLSSGKAFKVYTSADGFTCCVQSMFQDKLGRMWWGTGQGLYRFDGNRFFQVKQTGPW